MPRTALTLSRRGFIKRASTLAAAVAVPYIIPGRALRSAERAGANDCVRIGFIGAGRRANQLTALPRDARIVAISDCYLPAAEAMAAKHQCRAYKDYRKMLESGEVDAVIIATPDHWHTLPAIHACQAGKDIYLEKPMTLTIREGRQLVTAVRKYQRVFQTGSQQRSIALNRLGCELVRSGAIGRVQTVIAANYESPWECALPPQAIPDGLDWDTWCGQTEVVPYNKDIQIPRANPGWISLRPWSGGEMTGWGAHGFDQIQWALGTSLTGPVEVWTEGERFQAPTYTQPGSIADGNKICSRPLVRFRYANDVIVKLEDTDQRGGGKFIGEKGTITLDRAYLKSDPQEIVLDAMKGGELRTADDTGAHLANWIACIKSREMPVADVEIGHRSTTVCHLGNIARWTGRKLQWDPDREQFVGDAEANQLLFRSPRKGFEIPDNA
jgi:predicted dehydrogenase